MYERENCGVCGRILRGTEAEYCSGCFSEAMQHALVDSVTAAEAKEAAQEITG